MQHFKISIIFIIALTSGCTHLPREDGFSGVEQAVAGRVPQKVYWYQGDEEDEKARAALRALLQQPLTAQSAVQIALLNNRQLQVEYERLGIAQADLVQAGLLSNPILFAGIRFPKGGRGGNNIEFALAKEFLDVLLRPARQRLAEREFEQVRLRVAAAVLDKVAGVLTAYYRVQGKQRLQEIMALAADAQHATYALAQRFEQAGNLSEKELALNRGAAADMSAELLTAQTELVNARADLNGLLGLDASDRDWILADGLPELPGSDPEPDRLEDDAVEASLELRALKNETDQLAEALAMTRRYRWLGGADFGVSTERDPDGSRVTGPNFSIELPLFDQRQAAIARLESRVRQSRSRYQAEETALRNQVRSLMERMAMARRIAEYHRDEVIPARQQVVKFTRQEQNYMLVDIFELLFARQQEIQAYRTYVNALTDYWESDARLARAAGTAFFEGPDLTNDNAQPVE